MICNNTISLLVVFLIAIGVLSLSSSAAARINSNSIEQAPLRVFILVGQSNMVGHGTRYEIDEATGKQKNATLQWLVDNVPETYGMLKTKTKKQQGKSNKQRHSDNSEEWTVRKDVLIACNSRGQDDISPRVTNYGYLYAGLCTGKRNVLCTSYARLCESLCTSYAHHVCLNNAILTHICCILKENHLIWKIK